MTSPRRSVERGVAAAVLVVVATLGCGDGANPTASSGGGAAPRPSVVLITLDTTRADRLGCYGREDAGTPNIDALARRGVVFEDARTAVPITLPSHATILTGLIPLRHGVHDNGIAALGASARTLTESLQDESYSTGAFVGAFVLSRRFGLDQGFEIYDEVPDARRLSGGLMEERPADRVVDAALHFVADASSPFFVWVHLFDPHHPYAPPEPQLSRFADDPYQGEISFADAQVGRLIDAVGARCGDDVVFCIAADHGEGLGEHGELTHATFLYDSTLRVPLILAGRGVPAGQRFSAPVATVDVTPTLLELVGAPPLPATDGVSLTAWFRGETPARPTPLCFESYWGYLNHGWSPLLAISDGSRKLIDAPRAEFYDLVADPMEQRDRFEVAGKDALKMRRAVRTVWQRRASLAASRELDPEERRTLDQMGYLGGARKGPGDVPLPSAELPDPKDRVALLDVQNRALELLTRFDRDGDVRAIDEALEIVLAALAEDPDGAILNEFAGLAYAKKNDHQRAVPHLRRCLAARPDNLDARFALAYSLVHGGDPLAGRAELLRCLEEEPNFVKAARLLAVLHEAAGRVDDAISDWEYFLSRYPYDDEQATHARSQLLRLKDQRRADSDS